jgi:hypothetical protein
MYCLELLFVWVVCPVGLWSKRYDHKRLLKLCRLVANVLYPIA